MFKGRATQVSMQPAWLDTRVARTDPRPVLRVRPAATGPLIPPTELAPAVLDVGGAGYKGHGLGVHVPGSSCWCDPASCSLGSCGGSAQWGLSLRLPPPPAVGVVGGLGVALGPEGLYQCPGAANTKCHRWGLKQNVLSRTKVSPGFAPSAPRRGPSCLPASGAQV